MLDQGAILTAIVASEGNTYNHNDSLLCILFRHVALSCGESKHFCPKLTSFGISGDAALRIKDGDFSGEDGVTYYVLLS